MTTALEKLLRPILPVLVNLPCVVYDRKGRICHANDAFLHLSRHRLQSLLKRPLTRFLVCALENTPGRFRGWLQYDANRREPLSNGILKTGNDSQPAAMLDPQEEKNGRNVRLIARELGSSHVLLLAISTSRMTTKSMGRLSSDSLLRLDTRGRIVAVTEGLGQIAGRLLNHLFSKKPDGLFLPGMYQKALKRQDMLRKRMCRMTSQNLEAWEQVFRTDFSGSNWKAGWSAEKHLRFGRVRDGIRIDSSASGSGFLVRREPLDTEAYDYRWEVRLSGPFDKSIGLFFNGWDCVPDAKITSPEFGGYLAGLYSVKRWSFDYFRIKRRGWVMIHKRLASKRFEGKFNFSVEKSGGVFRMSLNRGPVFEYADPEYRGISDTHLTGMVFSGFPLVLHEAVLFRRRSVPLDVPVTDTHFDLRFAAHPEEVFEARFLDRISGRNRGTDIYLRRVTELRKIESANAALLREKSDALAEKSRALQQMNDELKVAAEVLNGLLPKDFPVVPGVRFHSYFKPSGQVGGDLFDVFSVDADRLAILMYDVSGHGVPAALVSVMTKTLFQKHYHPGATVLELLDKLNADLYRDMPGRGFVTLFFGLLDHKKRELRYAGAGFTTPVAVSGEDLLLLNTKGVPLGIGDRITSQEHVVSFDKPTKLLLFTDGLYEIFNAKDEFYGPKKMTAYIRKHALLSLEELIRHLLEEHRDFTAGLEQKDDISILGVELGAPAGEGRG